MILLSNEFVESWTRLQGMVVSPFVFDSSSERVARFGVHIIFGVTMYFKD